jgi:hypothetical protein
MPARKQNPKGEQPPQDVSKRTLDDWRRIYRAKAATPAAPAASSAAPAAPSSSSSSCSKAALDLIEETVTWLLTASKTDPQAHGVTRTWGCLCGEETLPCPYHTVELVLRSIAQYAVAYGLSPEDRQDLPLFHDGTGCPPTKARVVATFEALASRCNLPLLTAEGLRLYGGHSARVSGSQDLASAGVEASKIRIFARHSGDAILCYVADAPLAAIRTDLGLGKAKPTTKGLQNSTTSPAAAVNERSWKKLQTQLGRLTSTINEQQQQMKAIAIAARSHPCIVYVQNLTTLAIHGLRPGGGTATICGWPVGPKVIKRGKLRFLPSLKDESWETLCECCLLPERQAAKIVEALAIEQLDRTPAKDSLAA